MEVVEGSAARFDCKIEGTLDKHHLFLSFLPRHLSALCCNVALFFFFNCCVGIIFLYQYLHVTAWMCCSNRTLEQHGLVLCLP